MEEWLENLWICPLCTAEHPTPVVICSRCGCNLLLLNKIKLISYRLRQEGYPELSKRYYDEEQF